MTKHEHYGSGPAGQASCPEDLGELWRTAALALRASPTRRRFPMLVHVGCPGAAERTLPADAASDFGERVELVCSLIDALPNPVACDGSTPLLCWLTRPGELSIHDADLVWMAAVRHAAAELGLRLPFAVVTRNGWQDPATLVGREWTRLRTTPATPPRG